MSGLRIRLIGMLVIVMLLAFAFLLVGVNFGLRSDVRALADQSVDAGSAALSGAVDARTEQIRSAVLQGSAQTALANALRHHDHAALSSLASDLAVSGNLSFVAITDAKGNILAGSRVASGTLAKNGVVTSAAVGAVAGGVQALDGPALRALGLAQPAPAIAIGMASPVNVGGSTLGVLYGGTVLDATTKFVDDVSRFTGGAAGIAVGGKFVATSLSTKEGVKETGLPIADTIDGIDYYAKQTPLRSYEGAQVGTMWFAVPNAQFEAIVNNTLRQIVLWGLAGIVLALIVGTVVATRIGRAIVKRSDEVNESAQQLKVLVVGAEVSGDHVSRTRDTLEEIKTLVNAASMNGTGQLRNLAQTAVDDVVVIDTLTSELSNRMRDAALRVERLSEVAQELDELVAGAKASRN